ncbi:MAG: sulfatase [Planctomycetota bacterium]
MCTAPSPPPSLSLSLVLTLVVSTTAFARETAPPDHPLPKPNVLVILVDDLGWADLGCYGSTYHETPHIDRLAASGMRFTNGYAAAAVCSPTRASLMTGRYPARIGITDWIRARFQGGAIPPDKKNPSGYECGGERELLCPLNPLWLELEEITIAEVLRLHGYTTAHIGKWHLGPDDWYPEHQGFTINIGGCDYGQPPSYFDPYVGRQGSIPNLTPRREGEYLTDREADEAARFIRENRDGPFFLHLAHYAVHTPLQGRPDLVAKYEKKPPTQQTNATYAAMVESVDHAVGRVLATLEECGLTERTLVILTSDNGGLLGVTNNAPLRSGKGLPYEGGLRVPFIVSWPGVVRAGSETDQPAITCDIFPTVCEAACTELPGNRPIDGESLMPLLRGERGGAPRDLFWHFPHYRTDDSPPYSVVRSAGWKLIKRYAGKPFELFNLAQDPSETTDLAAQHHEKVMELDGKLKCWLGEMGAKLPKPRPDPGHNGAAGG